MATQCQMCPVSRCSRQLPVLLLILSVWAPWLLAAGSGAGNIDSPADLQTGETAGFTTSPEGPADGTIVVEVATYPRNSAQSFIFTGDVSGTAYGDGDLLWTGGVTTPGTYHSTEEPVFGWGLPSIRCDDDDSYGASRTATFELGVSEPVQCRFYNLQTGAGGE